MMKPSEPLDKDLVYPPKWWHWIRYAPRLAWEITGLGEVWRVAWTRKKEKEKEP